MKVVIIGKGKVGEATGQSLKCSVDYHDPAKGCVVTDFDSYDAAIICVDTLRENPYDHKALASVIKQLYLQRFKGLVLIRCTVSPEFIKAIDEDYQDRLRIVMFPEFMRQTDDLKMDTPWIVVLGGDLDDTMAAKNLLQTVGYCTDIDKYHLTSRMDSAILKLCQNAGLATKVIFYNMVNEICEKYGANYNNVRIGVGADERVGIQYSLVPSPDDGKKGFQGHCLPKDVTTLTTVETEHGFFKKLLEINKMLGR